MTRNNGMNLFYKPNGTLNIGKRFTSSELKHITMNTKHTLEIGGYKNGNKYIFQYMGEINNKGRKKCELGITPGKTYWHIHPTMEPFWPSLEDILRICHGTSEYVFTQYGYWKINRENVFRKNSPEIKSAYSLFKRQMNNLVGVQGWSIQKFKQILEEFTARMEFLGIKIYFCPWGKINYIRYEDQMINLKTMFDTVCK